MKRDKCSVTPLCNLSIYNELNNAYIYRGGALVHVRGKWKPEAGSKASQGGRAVGVPPTDSANKSHPRLHNRFAMLSKLTARSAIPPFELRFNPSTSINGAAYSPDSHNPMLGQAMVSGLFSAWSGLVGSALFCSGYVEGTQQASQRPRAVNLCMC